MKSPNYILTQSSALLILIGCLTPNSMCKYQTPTLAEISSSPSVPISTFSFLPVSQARMLGIMLNFSVFFIHIQSVSQTHFSSFKTYTVETMCAFESILFDFFSPVMTQLLHLFLRRKNLMNSYIGILLDLSVMILKGLGATVIVSITNN